MKLIPLSGKLGAGKYAAVSDEDFEYLSKFTWHLHKSSTREYVSRGTTTGRRPKVMMHREVANRMGLDAALEVDHRFGDTLDNCRHSLRPATRSQNQANRGPSKNNKTGIKGVYWRKDRGTFTSEFMVGGRRVRLGSFATSEEAEIAYDKASRLHHGEFANH